MSHQFHQPAAWPVEEADSRTVGPAPEKVFASGQTELTLGLLAAMAFQAVRDQQRPDLLLELAQTTGESFGMVSGQGDWRFSASQSLSPHKQAEKHGEMAEKPLGMLGGCHEIGWW
jgi:hypothetical protein